MQISTGGAHAVATVARRELAAETLARANANACGEHLNSRGRGARGRRRGSGGALAAAKLRMLCELAGTWPEQLRMLMVALIGKPRGLQGHLPVCWTLPCMVQAAQEAGPLLGLSRWAN